MSRSPSLTAAQAQASQRGRALTVLIDVGLGVRRWRIWPSGHAQCLGPAKIPSPRTPRGEGAPIHPGTPLPG